MSQLFLLILTAVILSSVGADCVASAQFSEEELVESTTNRVNDAHDTQNYPAEWLFDVYFQGITLTPEQREFAIAEFHRYDQAFFSFGQARIDQGQTWSEAEAIAFEAEFLNQLSAKFSPAQIQQVQENIERAKQAVLKADEILLAEQPHWEAEIQQQLFEQWFEGIEPTPEQEQFVRAEIARSEQAFNEMTDRAEAEGRFWNDAEVEAVEDEFYIRLEQGLSLEQIQQVRDNRKRLAREVKADLN